MASPKYNRTLRYVLPYIKTLPAKVSKLLYEADIIGAYMGNDLMDLEGLHIVTKKEVATHPQFLGQYYDFKLKGHVTVIQLEEEFVKNFWEGKYDQLYPTLYHVPKVLGKKLNKAYHVLKNTSIGKQMHKEYLVKYNYVDLKTFQDWENFQPEQSDLKPFKEQEILNFGLRP